MSFDHSITTSSWGLRTHTHASSISKSNLDNYNTPGHTRKQIHFKPVHYDGKDLGALISDVSRVFDEKLFERVLSQNSLRSQYEVDYDFKKQINQLMGSVKDSHSLSSLLQNTLNAYQSLKNDPQNLGLKSVVISSLNELSHTFKSQSSHFLELRSQMDLEIGDGVDLLNASLNQIHHLNIEIVAQPEGSHARAMLEDQRDQELEKIASWIPINYMKRKSGGVAIYVEGSGHILLDRHVNEIEFHQSSPMGYFKSGHSLILNGHNISPFISSGKMAALFTLRDRVIPNLQNEIDDLGSEFGQRMNEISNNFAPYPLPQSLTSSRYVHGLNDRFSGVGKVRLGSVHQVTQQASYHDIDLSKIFTIKDLVNKINQLKIGKASIENHRLTIKALNDHSLVFHPLDSQVSLFDSHVMKSHHPIDPDQALKISGDFTLHISHGQSTPQNNSITVSYTKGMTLNQIITRLNNNVPTALPFTASYQNGRLVIQGGLGKDAQNQFTVPMSLSFSDSGILSEKIGLNYSGKTQSLTHYFGFNHLFQDHNQGQDLYIYHGQKKPQDVLNESVKLSINGHFLHFSRTNTYQDVIDRINLLTAVSARWIRSGNQNVLKISALFENPIQFHNMDQSNDFSDIRLSYPGLGMDLAVEKSLLDYPEKLTISQLASNHYENENKILSDISPLKKRLVPLDPGQLKISGSFGSVLIDYDANTSLRSLEKKINDHPELSQAQVRAYIEEDKDGFKFNIRSHQSSYLHFSDTVTGNKSLSSVLGLVQSQSVHERSDEMVSQMVKLLSRQDMSFGGQSLGRQFSFQKYAAHILSKNSMELTHVKSSFDYQNHFFKELNHRLRSASGVNQNEELKLFFEVQNAFNASAKVLKQIFTMYNTLLDIT